MLDEPGTEAARELFVSARSVQSSRVLVPEAHAALARARRGGRYSPGGAARARGLLNELLAEIAPIELNEAVAARAGELADGLELRGADAVHLASYQEAEVGSSVLVTADGNLARAALSLGHAVAVPA